MAGICFGALLPVLVSWAEWRSGVLKLIKELLREKLLDCPYGEWLKRNQEKPSFVLASSENTMYVLCQTSVFVPRKAPGKRLWPFSTWKR